jgi:hypothetical protein
VAFVRTDVSEDRISYIIRLKRTSVVDPNLLILYTLMMVALPSYKTSVFTRAIQRHIPEDGILQAATRL